MACKIAHCKSNRLIGIVAFQSDSSFVDIPTKHADSNSFLKVLLANGSNVDATDGITFTALSKAASMGHSEIAEVILCTEIS